MSRDRLVKAIRGHARAQAAEAEATTQLANVVRADPWELELLESRGTLHDDEVTVTQWVRRYHATDVVDPGDTVVVVRKKTGGDIHWIVTDVLSDKTPATYIPPP